MLNDITAQSGNTYTNVANLFGSYIANNQVNWDTFSFELKAGNDTIYLGTDGTQIGLYGGSTPYSSQPTIPYVTSKEISKKSENGKLKVSLKVAIPDGNL